MKVLTEADLCDTISLYRCIALQRCNFIIKYSGHFIQMFSAAVQNTVSAITLVALSSQPNTLSDRLRLVQRPTSAMNTQVFLLSMMIFLIIVVHDAEGWRRRRRRRCPPQNCAVDSWSNWSPSTCPIVCGKGGKQTRSRKETRAKSCGGTCPYPLSESRSCDVGCPNGATPVAVDACICRSGFRGMCCDIGAVSTRCSL